MRYSMKILIDELEGLKRVVEKRKQLLASSSQENIDKLIENDIRQEENNIKDLEKALYQLNQ